MAEIAASIRQSIETFLTAARKQYTLTAVYLYGSYARDTATQWSDIDLALISPTFSENIFDDQVRLMQLAATIDDRIEPYPFTETTFTINNPLAYEIQRYGIQLYPPACMNTTF
jgi:uncharacterized protein